MPLLSSISGVNGDWVTTEPTSTGAGLTFPTYAPLPGVVYTGTFRLAEEDVERIARRVAQILEEMG